MTTQTKKIINNKTMLMLLGYATLYDRAALAMRKDNEGLSDDFQCSLSLDVMKDIDILSHSESTSNNNIDDIEIENEFNDIVRGFTEPLYSPMYIIYRVIVVYTIFCKFSIDDFSDITRYFINEIKAFLYTLINIENSKLKRVMIKYLQMLQKHYHSKSLVGKEEKLLLSPNDLEEMHEFGDILVGGAAKHLSDQYLDEQYAVITDLYNKQPTTYVELFNEQQGE
ncbi:MAG: hypothetical protein ACRCY4_09550 [Brevinema sp.]